VLPRPPATPNGLVVVAGCVVVVVPNPPNPAATGVVVLVLVVPNPPNPAVVEPNAVFCWLVCGVIEPLPNKEFVVGAVVVVVDAPKPVDAVLPRLKPVEPKGLAADKGD